MPGSIRLRGGHTTTDIRLDRLPEFDEQSREYPVRALLTSDQQQPRGYTWSVNHWFDQGSDGACVGFAGAHELVARPSEVQLPREGNAFAKEDLYWEAQKIDPWAGGAYPGASPFYEGTSILAGQKVLQRLGYIEEYRWAFGVEDLALAVGYKGPAIIGVPWYQGMFKVHSCGFIHVTGSQAGGHAVVVHSVDADDHYFRIWNSWGRDWGNEGTAKVSFEEMAKLLASWGEAVIPITRVREPENA